MTDTTMARTAITDENVRETLNKYTPILTIAALTDVAGATAAFNDNPADGQPQVIPIKVDDGLDGNTFEAFIDAFGALRDNTFALLITGGLADDVRTRMILRLEADPHVTVVDTTRQTLDEATKPGGSLDLFYQRQLTGTAGGDNTAGAADTRVHDQTGAFAKDATDGGNSNLVGAGATKAWV